MEVPQESSDHLAALTAGEADMPDCQVASTEWLRLESSHFRSPALLQHHLVGIYCSGGDSVGDRLRRLLS